MEWPLSNDVNSYFLIIPCECSKLKKTIIKATVMQFVSILTGLLSVLKRLMCFFPNRNSFINDLEGDDDSNDDSFITFIE